MNINDAFPSSYLKASDLAGKRVALTISHVEMEDVGRTKDRRPVAYFIGTEKGMVLNKTNANTIAKLHGTDTDSWSGKRIVLFETDVEFSGEMVRAIRVAPSVPPPANGASRPAQRPTQPEPPAHMDEPPAFDGVPADEDDRIPF